MNLKEFGSIVLTATITAMIVAPLVFFLFTWLGGDGDLRTPIVASITAAATASTVVAKQGSKRA